MANATLSPGLSLYDTLAPVYQLLVGSHPDEFRFRIGHTPLSTWPEVIGIGVGYIIVIFSIQALLRTQSPISFPLWSRFHNMALSVGSALLLALFVEETLKGIAMHGLHGFMCDTSAWTHRIELLFYINYLYKYYELLDTLLLAFKKKPLEFLHYFHHSMTIVLCYVMLIYKVSISWVPLMINLSVHVIMYYYFYLASRGIRVWWKKYITTIQITQFVVDLMVLSVCMYQYFAPRLGITGSARCEGFAGLGGTFAFGLLFTYLCMFLNMYMATYVTGTRKRESTTRPLKRD